MSKISISGAATGTATFTIESPATNTNRTLTIPDATTTLVGTDATQTLTNKSIVATQLTGTIAAARLPAGSVLQVVSTTKTDVFTTTSTSFVDVTGFSVSITPSSASSKILVMVSFYMSSNSGGGYPQARILRDSTAIYIGDASGSRTQALTNTGGGLFTSDAGTGFNISAQFVDSPATTSSTTYKIQLRQNAGNTARINASGNNADDGGGVRTASSITVMEIAA